MDDDILDNCISKQLDGWSKIKVLAGLYPFFIPFLQSSIFFPFFIFKKKEQKSKTEALNNCEFCLDNAKKHLILSLGSKVCIERTSSRIKPNNTRTISSWKSYLCVPETVSIVEGHCFIVPIQHYMSSIMVDEDVWSEMQVFERFRPGLRFWKWTKFVLQNFRRALVDMFKSRNLDCIFVEQFSNEKNFEHMFIECIPISYDAAEVAPMYFKVLLFYQVFYFGFVCLQIETFL